MFRLTSFVHASLASPAHDETAQTMAEYGVVLTLVTLAVLGAMTLLSARVSGAFEGIAGLL
jgi:Flp pilus assembly pilin Flp